MRRVTGVIVGAVAALGACGAAGLGAGASVAGASSASSASIVGFQSPTHNIGCQLARFDRGWSVRCDIRKRSWHPPPKPRSCQLDYGQGIELGSGRARIVCAGDTAIDTHSRVLRYGRSLSRGGVRCTSRESGMTCVHGRHGFTLSRQRYTLH